MEPNSVAEKANEIIKNLGNIEITPMTKEETAILIQRQIDLANTLIKFTREIETMKQKFNDHQTQILNLDAEISISEAFIYSKGLRKEYQGFKAMKLKIFNRNRKFK